MIKIIIHTILPYAISVSHCTYSVHRKHFIYNLGISIVGLHFCKYDFLKILVDFLLLKDLEFFFPDLDLGGRIQCTYTIHIMLFQGDGESVPVTPPNEVARPVSAPRETKGDAGNPFKLRLELDAVVTTLLVVGVVTRFFR